MLMPLVDILGFKNIDKDSDNLKELLIAKFKSLCVSGKSISCDVYSLSVEEIEALIELLEKEQRVQITNLFLISELESFKNLAILKDKGLRVSHLDI